MERTLAGKVALVTGSSAGLGLAIAEGLAAAGSSIALHGLALPADMAQACATLSRRHEVPVRYFHADLSRTAAIDDLTAAIEAELGAPDILVNNAAVRHTAPIERFGRDAWEDSLAVNLSAAFHLTRWTLPAMRQRGWGRILNISSIYGQRAVRDRVGYVTTKTALLGFTRAVAAETAEISGLTCNAICPGTVDTPAILDRIAVMARGRGTGIAEAQAEYLGTRQPTRRFVSQEKVAALAVFLCSDAADDITGAALPIDGAWSAV
jgi:3-hydroxybutyrate dehydrogenase